VPSAHDECQRHDVGHVGAPKDALGHQIVGDLGASLMAMIAISGRTRFGGFRAATVASASSFAIGDAAANRFLPRQGTIGDAAVDDLHKIS
jgi:hypothetical protein